MMATQLTRSEMTDVLKKRTQWYAQENTEPEQVEERMTVLSFSVGGETYGVETQYVNRVNLIKNLTLLPGTPAFIAGIINVHGKIIPVIDIKIFFELENKENKISDKIIIISVDDADFGILAEEVQGLIEIPHSKIQPILPSLTGVREAFLKGVSDEQMVILDPRKMANDKNIVIDNE